eukprot:TRINITY_DN48546_c0_g1_i1.p1 TRINITY_DN48546_c0_g1~~TRINITY_DN48546_c0_g1_i1.p1  ORF type:complete len:342 (-),score=45.84 TRINITY_DN48546_c0_g1_i1:21-1046(-)
MALPFRRPLGPSLLEPEIEAAIKRTLPVFTKNSQQISVQLYANLFEQYPHLKPMFSLEFLQTPAQCKSSPAVSMSPQAKILSDSIVNFCANLDNLHAMKAAVDRICTKHVSRHVKSEHYPAVAAAFSKACRQVLNDQLSEQDLNAWDTAVTALAGILVKTEQQMYDLLKSNERHWEGFRAFSVEGSEQQPSPAGGTVSRQMYKMCPTDGGKLPKYSAGESICLRVNHDDYGLVHCPVSLCARERKGEIQISIPVRANPSKGASSESVLKEKLDGGEMIEVSSPIANLLKKQKSGKSHVSAQNRMPRQDYVRVREANAMPGVYMRGHTAQGSSRQQRRLPEK